jgi:hypothetical protein
MEKGQIVESGTHDELILTQSRYYDLVKLQTLNESEMSPSKAMSASKSYDFSIGASEDIETGKDEQAKEHALESSKSLEDGAELDRTESAQVMKRIRGLMMEHPFLILLGCTGALIFGGLFPG